MSYFTGTTGMIMSMLIDLENAKVDPEVNLQLWLDNWDLLREIEAEYAQKRTTKAWALMCPKHKELFRQLGMGHMLARRIDFPTIACGITPLPTLEDTQKGPIYLSRGNKWANSAPPQASDWVNGINPNKD